MAWIEVIDQQDAQDELAEFYQRYNNQSLVPGEVDNFWKVLSLHLAGLKASEAMYLAIMKGSRTFSAGEREMVATVVSGINSCHY